MILPRETKTQAKQSELGPLSDLSGPGTLYRLPCAPVSSALIKIPYSLSDVIADQNARAVLNLNLRKDFSDTFRAYVCE